MIKRRLWTTLAVAVALASAVVGPAEASHRVLAYKGKLGHGGAIRIDLAGTRARVFFAARCTDKGSEPHEEQEVSTYPVPAIGPYVPEVLYEPLSGHVRAGGLSIYDELDIGETNNEASQRPEAQVRLRARISPHRVSGVFSLDQAQAGGTFEGTGLTGCSTGTIRFTARR